MRARAILTPINGNLRKALDSSLIFFTASLATGIFNYFFQILVARGLTTEAFASFNHWFADMAVFFVFASLAQYAANFYPSRGLNLRLSIIAINLIIYGFVWGWLALPLELLGVKATLIITAAVLFGWLLGQVQVRLMFITMAMATLLTGLAKVLLALAPISVEIPIERYRFAILACYLPALWVVSFSVWLSPEHEFDSEQRSYTWTAPIILSIAGAVIPQLDLVLLARLQTPGNFAVFAQASLFYKGIYFLFFIITQWLLPHQLRTKNSGSDKVILSFFPIIPAVLGSLLIAVVSPWVSMILLGWQVPPPMSIVFLSCLNMSLLTWLFFLIQDGCAGGKTRVTGLAVVALAVEALLQIALELPLTGYLTFGIFFQVILVYGLARQLLRT